MNFREKWIAAVENKNSVLCAGLDPAAFEMGRGAKGLPDGADKLQWSLDYLNQVAPYCAAVKPNVQYWKHAGDMSALETIGKAARDLGLLVIDDSKLADIGSTNEAGIWHARERADALTIAPYAGNMAEAATQAQTWGIGAITMCLMSNPEYETEKNQLAPVDPTPFDTADLLFSGDTCYTRRFLKLAHDAQAAGIDGIVIGAPSEKNHITDQEIERVRRYAGDEMLVLLPGVDAQGGEAGAIWKHFGPKNVIVNVGRSLMFPEDKTSAEAAQAYKEKLNELRYAG